jgi:hypothetical protein
LLSVSYNEAFIRFLSRSVYLEPGPRAAGPGASLPDLRVVVDGHSDGLVVRLVLSHHLEGLLTVRQDIVRATGIGRVGSNDDGGGIEEFRFDLDKAKRLGADVSDLSHDLVTPYSLTENLFALTVSRAVVTM